MDQWSFFFSFLFAKMFDGQKKKKKNKKIINRLTTPCIQFGFALKNAGAL